MISSARAVLVSLATLTAVAVGLQLLRSASEATSSPMGAAALFENSSEMNRPVTERAIRHAGNDTPVVYARKCHVVPRHSGTQPRPCRFNRNEDLPKILLIGDSHAAMWQAPLRLLAFEEGFELIVATKAACPFTATDSILRRDTYRACGLFAENLVDMISDLKPEILIWTQKENTRYFDSTLDQISDSHAQALEQLSVLTDALIVIRDVPRWPVDPHECVRQNPDCSMQLSENRQAYEKLWRAAQTHDATHSLDLNHLVCRGNTCKVIVGGMVAWRDRHHFNNSYGETMAPFLAATIRPFLLEAKSRD